MKLLLQNGDFVIEVIWLAIILLAGFFTWVKKIIEKKANENRTDAPRKRVDVGGSVRAQIEKYMRAAEQSPLGRGGLFTPDEPPDEPPPRPTPAAPPVARPAPRRLAPQPVSAAEAAKELERKLARPAAAKRPAYSASMGAGIPAALGLRARTLPRARIRLTRKNAKAAVVLAEVLGPPVGMRSDYRLF